MAKAKTTTASNVVTGESNTQQPNSAAETTTKAPAKKLELVKVRSTLESKPDGGNPVALREVNPAHPGGECFIAGPKVVEVALTGEVKAKLREGVLEEVDE